MNATDHRNSTNRPGTATRRRRGFTVIEILVVIAIIILLLSILIVALNKAAASAQVAKSRNLMGSIGQALVQFNTDVGYYPPVLNDARALVEPPLPGPSLSAGGGLSTQDWFSVTSAADYLIGYGNEQQDGYGAPGDATRGALGIRSPGRDGVWSATVYGSGELDARNGGPGVSITGQVLGPYLELKDDRLLATIDQSGMVRYPGDPGYSLEDDEQSGVIVDYWGRPIRYYRRPYPPGAIGQSLRAVDRDGDGITDQPPTLGDVFVLRPYDVPTGGAIDGRKDGNGDGTTTIELNAAEFALLSFGPDGIIDATVRRDDEDRNGDGISLSNQDNIVETGP